MSPTKKSLHRVLFHEEHYTKTFHYLSAIHLYKISFIIIYWPYWLFGISFDSDMFDKCFLKHIYDVYKMTLKIHFHLFFPTHLYEFFHFSPLNRKKIFWKLCWPPLPLSDFFWTLPGLCLIGGMYSSWTSRTVSVSSLCCACRDFTLLASFSCLLENKIPV